ncbi:unnamed protein product, partial [Arctia plantaginis]
KFLYNICNKNTVKNVDDLTYEVQQYCIYS